MRKVALVFVLAVFGPSLALAWLAWRSLSNQQLAFERQQTLLYQGTCAGYVKDVSEFLGTRQKEFARHVELLLATRDPQDVAGRLDDELLKTWPMAEVGFAVSLDGHVLAPPLLARPEARRFRLENDLFLSNQESVEVYWTGTKGIQPSGQAEFSNENPPDDSASTSKETRATPSKTPEKSRKVIPEKDGAMDAKLVSKLSSGEAEFRQLIGDANEGIIARFLQNRLKLLLWYRSPGHPEMVFGAQLKLVELVKGLRNLIQAGSALHNEICVALLDENGRPVAQSHRDFAADWKHPFVSVEVGEALPHWEVAAYLVNPAKLRESEQAIARTLGSLVLLLLLAIGLGGWRIVTDLKRQLTLARQKTDFVSNVSHELKTPLTSIRMFSELLAEGRITDEEKRRTFLHIITAEVARLTRLINNVLDFARMERGEQQYNFQPCDLTALVRESVAAFRPHLEANGFTLSCEVGAQPCFVSGDRDALAQVLVNLLSNAEKYSAEKKEIAVSIAAPNGQPASVEVRVTDHGLGVPRGSEEKIFEQFYRAHDSLNSGIQGSGLGLTLARQIARAHGGDALYEPRPGGGSIFVLRLHRP